MSLRPLPPALAPAVRRRAEGPVEVHVNTPRASTRSSTIGRLPWWVTVVILVREIGITLLRLSVIRHGVLPASWGGKVKTFLQAVAIGLFVLPLHGLLLWVAWAVMAAALAITVATGVDYVFRAWSLRQNSERTRQRRQRRRKQA